MKKIFIAVLLLSCTGTMAQQGRRSNPALDSLRNEKKPEMLEQKIHKLANGSEQDMRLLISYYGNSNRKKADSLVELTVQKFPTGSMAFTLAQNNLFTEQDAGKQEMLFGEIQKKFPDQNMDMGRHSVAYAYAKEKNIKKAEEYISLIQAPTSRAVAARLSAELIMNYDLESAEKILRTEINQLTGRGVPDENTSGPVPDAKLSYFSFLNVYGGVLLKQGKYDEALKYIQEAYNGSANKDVQLTGNYGLVLNKTGQYPKAFPLLEKLVKEGKANNELKAALAEGYTKLNPGRNTQVYLANIDQQLQDHIKAEVAKLLINEAAPDFKVKDIHGKTVSTAEFKGKTIVLDFWATWCGPCKKSFPAMQMAVNKYEKDNDVKFLFIHTWEQVADPLADARKYFADNKYTFDLYMDTKNSKTGINEAVTAFKVKGIPAKFIIDGKGNIRFKVTGFSGGDDAAVAELSAMIDIAKKAG